MKIAIIGTGAIGGLFLAYLSERYTDIVCIGRPYQVTSFLKEGLFIEGVRGSKHITDIKITTSLKDKVDLAILAVKTQDLENIIADNKQMLKNSILMTTQNGVTADHILAKEFKKKNIITSIVMFGATFTPPNKIVHNFEGELVLGNIFKEPDEKIMQDIKDICSGIFECHVVPDIQGAKYLKIFLNLNNSIPACIGMSMQDAYADPDVCRVAIGLIREAYGTITQAKIQLDNLPSFNKDKILGFVRMPFDDAAVLFSKIMTGLSKEPLYGSILQSIQRKRPTEIDYINGQIAAVAKELGQHAPLNEKITEMVHSVETSGRFYLKEDFLKETLELARRYNQ